MNNRPNRMLHLLPTPGNVVFSILLLVSFVWANNVWGFVKTSPMIPSSSTTTIAYQGRLAQANGIAITGTMAMEFRLYAAATGGSSLWTETWAGSNMISVNAGLFNVLLGSLTPIPQTVISNNSSLWLGIRVGSDAELTPRVQLGSVPYAIQALTVPNNSITSAKIADGAVSSTKQTLVTYHNEDGRVVSVVGQVNDVTLSEFIFTNVPAGDILIIASLTAYRKGTNTDGSIGLEINGLQQIDSAPSHNAQVYGTQFTLHGRYTNPTAGTIVVKIKANGEKPATNVRYGNNDGGFDDNRFGRHVTLLAGL